MALPLAVPAVLGIMRFAAQKGVQQAIKKYGREAYNAALGVAKDKGAKGQQVRSQLQKVAERSKEQASNIPKPVRDMMIPKGSNKTPARREAPMRAERDTPVTPKRESTRARVAERKERMAKGAERRKASETPSRRNVSATTAGVAGATAIASATTEKDNRKRSGSRTGGGRGDGAAEVRARRAQAQKEADVRRVKAATKARKTAAEGKAKGRTGGSTSKNYNVGVSKGGVSFKEAFRHFRNKGQKTFTWNGKKYTTKLKEEN